MTVANRKSIINIFLWIHIVVLLLIPLCLTIVGTLIIDYSDITSIDDLRNNDDYMNYALAGLIIQACINTYLAVLLAII